MIINTQAIALQIRPWSKTSHMVTWLTPAYGKIITPVKGACRPKSAFLGQYDLFYTCDLNVYRRERNGIHAIRECTPVTLREALRHEWRQTAAAAYLADLTVQTTVGHQHMADLYALLTQALDTLTGHTATPRDVILWYETHLLRVLGLMPDFTLCPLCHTPDTPLLRFSLTSGRFICPHLAQRQAQEAVLTLPRRVQSLFLDYSRRTAPSDESPKKRGSPDGEKSPPSHLLLGLSRFLGIFISFHLDVPPTVRRVAFELIDTKLTHESALSESEL